MWSGCARSAACARWRAARRRPWSGRGGPFVARADRVRLLRRGHDDRRHGGRDRETSAGRRRLAGRLARVAASPDGPVLLLAPSALIGPSRLATVDAGGAVEQVPLDGVSAGPMPTELVPSVERVRTPALAVDSHGRRPPGVLAPVRR